MSSPETSARRRHPTARSAAPAAAVRPKLAARLRANGAPHPDVGARLLSLRGRLGFDQPSFARKLGVGIATLAAAEDGMTERDALPPPLAALVSRDRGAARAPG